MHHGLIRGKTVENISEEVYAEINLLPKHDQTEPVNPDFYHSEFPRPQIHSFCKVLTASDTKSNWGLSIPQKDAVKCFPLLVVLLVFIFL